MHCNGNHFFVKIFYIKMTFLVHDHLPNECSNVVWVRTVFFLFWRKNVKKMHSGRYCIQICAFSSTKAALRSFSAASAHIFVYNTCLNAFFNIFFVKIEKNCPNLQQSNIFFVKIVPIYIFDDFSNIFCQNKEKIVPIYIFDEFFQNFCEVHFFSIFIVK